MCTNLELGPQLWADWLQLSQVTHGTIHVHQHRRDLGRGNGRSQITHTAPLSRVTLCKMSHDTNDKEVKIRRANGLQHLVMAC